MKNIKLSVLLMLSLQSIMHAAQESKSPENKMYHMQEIPSLQNIIVSNILIDFNNKIDQDTPLSQEDFDGWIDYLTKHQILFKDVINEDIHSQDNKIVVQKGDLLRKASEKNNVHMVQLLLAAGADINIKKNVDNTPLHIAVVNNNTEVARMLIDAGADINIKNEHGWTPLFVAVVNNNTELVRMLIDAGADINIKNNVGNIPYNKGWTSLHWAAFWNGTEVARILLDAGADLNLQNNVGRTAEQLARTDEMRAIFVQARRDRKEK